jgi:adenylosuccinate lyase
VPESFLATDGILSLYVNVINGLTVYPKMIARHLNEELPFMATENILMYCVGKGGDRQLLHEAIRGHSVECQRKVKDGGENDLLTRIAGDARFGITRAELDKLLSSAFTGMAGEQTEKFVKKVKAVLQKHGGETPEVKIKV